MFDRDAARERWEDILLDTNFFQEDGGGEGEVSASLLDAIVAATAPDDEGDVIAWNECALCERETQRDASPRLPSFRVATLRPSLFTVSLEGPKPDGDHLRVSVCHNAIHALVGTNARSASGTARSRN